MKLWRRLVRADALGDPRRPGQTPNHSGGGPCQPLAVVTEEHQAEPLADSEVHGSSGTRCERNRHRVAALAMHDEDAMTSLETELVDVRAEGL